MENFLKCRILGAPGRIWANDIWVDFSIFSPLLSLDDRKGEAFAQGRNSASSTGNLYLQGLQPLKAAGVKAEELWALRSFSPPGPFLIILKLFSLLMYSGRTLNASHLFPSTTSWFVFFCSGLEKEKVQWGVWAPPQLSLCHWGAWDRVCAKDSRKTEEEVQREPTYCRSREKFPGSENNRPGERLPSEAVGSPSREVLEENNRLSGMV